MKIERYQCDICEKPAKHLRFSLQVIFTTEQTEGRSTSPHLSTEKLDLCEKCMEHICGGNYVWAHGAQGCNTYYFPED
jgi:hypothetical protein